MKLINIDELKLKFIRKSNRFNEFINLFKGLIRTKENHINTIGEEGLSVVEYSMGKEDVKGLNKEINILREIIPDLEKLHIFYEDWKIRVGKG